MRVLESVYSITGMTRLVVVGQPELRNKEEMEVDFLLSPLSFLVPLKGHFIALSPPFQAFFSLSKSNSLVPGMGSAYCPDHLFISSQSFGLV
jgi:hypothetical protein